MRLFVRKKSLVVAEAILEVSQSSGRRSQFTKKGAITHQAIAPFTKRLSYLMLNSIRTLLSQ